MANIASLAEARSHNVPPDVFLRHYREIRDCKRHQADANMAVARAKKSAKEIGIDLEAFRLLEKLAALDLDEAEMQLSHLRQYAAWIELPIGTQLDAFGAPPQPAAVDAKDAAEQREWQAGDEGLQAGKAGHERDVNPFEAGSAEYVAWDKAWAKGNKVWLKGQERIAGEMGPKAGNGAAAPVRKRGKPKSSEAQAAIF
jgi:hypothetical protein